MTDTKHIPLRIEPVSGGGFVVSDAWHNDLGRLCGPLFACTTLGEALDFIRSRLAPEDLKPAEAKQALGKCGCDRCNPVRSQAIPRPAPSQWKAF